MTRFFSIKSYLSIFLLILFLEIIFLVAFYLNTPAETNISSPQLQVTLIRTPTPSPTSWPKLTLDRIFSDQKVSLPDKTVTVVITGDVIPARTVNRIMRERNNFLYPFSETATFLRGADITLINLESPLIEGCPTTNAGMMFCGDTRFIEGLAFAGIDVVNLANNHTVNYGKSGLDNTIQLLRGQRIIPVGLGKTEFLDQKGMVFAFIGYNGIAPLDQNLAIIDKKIIKREIEAASKKADVIIVSFHWGKEYVRHPQFDPGVALFDPMEIAHFAVDVGADVIIGNHPHWYQGIEIYKGKTIFYALGNFIFDQFWSEQTKKGFIAKLYFLDKELVDIDVFPIYINGIKPIFAQDSVRQEILLTLKEESQKLTSAESP